MKIFKYQEKAINELEEIISDKLKIYEIDKKRGEKTYNIHFISPTGSGKTVMSFQFMDLLSKDDQEYAFIWIAPNKLHTQSKDKFVKISSNSLLNPIDFEDITGNILEKNDILCLNWASIVQVDNIYRKPNELGNFLENIIEKTKESGLKIIAFIDESHIASQNEKTNASKFLSEILKPLIQINITATPKGILENDDKIIVNRNEVVTEGVIKKAFIFNELNSIDHIDKFALIDAAYDKLLAIKNEYSINNIKINPLLIIQIENTNAEEISTMKDSIENYLLSKGIHKDLMSNYLSEDKTNSEDLARNDNPVQIVFTKTAIATGWDCPRASVLLTFRKSNDAPFKTQVLGRISRMPELKHYENDLLDIAYVYSDMKDYIPDDKSSDIKVYSKAEEQFQITLKNDCIELFNLLFFNKEKLKDFFTEEKDELIKKEILRLTNVFWNSINLDQTDIKSKIILNLKINNPDISFSENPISEYYLNGKEIEKLFKEILRKSGFIDSKNNSEFELFKNKIDAFQNLLLNTFNMRSENLTYKFKDIIPILVSNGSKFMEYIQEIKEFENSTLFENFNRDNIFENLSETDIWNPELEFNSTLIDENESKNIFSPTCLKNINELERLFLCNLENNEEVEYWFRNGNNGEKYFSIIYQQKDSTISNFYPDFIVKYKNGQIGIYDTKSTDSGVNDKAKEKAEFLYSYCHKFGYVGGLILMKSVGSDNSGIKRFYINSKEFYDFDNKSDWTEFSPEFKISEYKKFKK